MLLTEDPGMGDFHIQSYDPGCLTINKIEHKSSVIISPKELIDKWSPQSLAELSPNDCELILKLKPDIILLGTGELFALATPKQIAPLYEAGLSVECMDTAAACRTYLALSAEGRNVAAALLIR